MPSSVDSAASPSRTQAKRLGCEEPRIWTRPLRKLTPKTSLGFSVIEFAEDVLGIDLIPWQKWLLIHMLELLPDNSLRFRTVIVLVARQNGKSTLSQVLALWFMYVYGVALVIGTAQDLDVAEEIWQGAVDLAEESEDLAPLIEKVVRVNGKKALELTGGERYKVKAANRRAGRGLSGDLILLDELREHQSWDAWGAITKDLPNSTPMLMADGTWKRLDEVMVDDRVFAPSGDTVAVTKVQPIDELRPMYRVRTSDGRELVASESHLWTVKDTRHNYDLSAAWEILTTAQIVERGLLRQGKEYAFRLPHQQALRDLPDREFEIPPYVLGAWLGDGTTDDGTLTVGAQDLNEMRALLKAAGATITSETEEPSGAWRVRLHIDGVPLRTLLRRQGLLGNKHVPAEYLTASTDQRLALLRGLIDTDGNVTKLGLVRFTSTRETLVDAARFLARSLGWDARKSSFMPRIKGRACGQGWYLVFTPTADDAVPASLKRKAARCGRGTRRRHASIVAVEPVATEPSRCIAVDSTDHLFLAGTDLVPTHNTAIARANALVCALSNAGDVTSLVLRFLRQAAIKALVDTGEFDELRAELVDPAMLVVDENVVDEGAEDEDTLGIFEWSAPPGIDVWNRDGWPMANPSLGYTITERTLASACRTDPEWIFRTECLCQWSDGVLEGPFPPGSWDASEDKLSRRAEGSPVALCVAVSEERATAHICLAARRADGIPHIEVVTSRPGTDWVIPWFQSPERSAAVKAAPIAVHARGAPESSLIEAMEAAKLKVVQWPSAEVANATGNLYDRVRFAIGMCSHGNDRSSCKEKHDGEPSEGVRHIGQPVLNAAAATALPKLTESGAFVWDRRKSPSDVAPLHGVTGALWCLTRNDKTKTPTVHAWPTEQAEEAMS